MSICGRVDQQGLLRDGMCDWVEPASFLSTSVRSSLRPLGHRLSSFQELCCSQSQWHSLGNPMLGEISFFVRI
ncbi:Protein of unknown function [Gryllus bimaculatus]|nr:Protein of unknown function [Gryllus bimaculatus]